MLLLLRNTTEYYGIGYYGILQNIMDHNIYLRPAYTCSPKTFQKKEQACPVAQTLQYLLGNNSKGRDRDGGGLHQTLERSWLRFCKFLHKKKGGCVRRTLAMELQLRGGNPYKKKTATATHSWDCIKMLYGLSTTLVSPPVNLSRCGLPPSSRVVGHVHICNSSYFGQVFNTGYVMAGPGLRF